MDTGFYINFNSKMNQSFSLLSYPLVPVSSLVHSKRIPNLLKYLPIMSSERSFTPSTVIFLPRTAASPEKKVNKVGNNSTADLTKGRKSGAQH